MTSTLVRTYDHLLQVDEDVRRAVEAFDPESAESAESIELYAHMSASAHIWCARVQDRTPRHAVWPDLDLGSAAEITRSATVALRREARRVEAGDGDRSVTYRNSAGDEFENRTSDILMHVALHAAFHRGQLAKLVRRGGEEPDWAEYIGFVRGAPTPGAGGAD